MFDEDCADEGWVDDDGADDDGADDDADESCGAGSGLDDRQRAGMQEIALRHQIVRGDDMAFRRLDAKPAARRDIAFVDHADGGIDNIAHAIADAEIG